MMDGHDFEKYYTLSPWNYLFFVFIIVVWIFLQLKGKNPRIESVRDFTNIVNTRGGNIIVLGMASIWFFSASMRLFYYAIELISSNKMDEKSAVLMMALQFATGSAFGAAMGSMLKTMTGSEGTTESKAGDSPSTTTTMIATSGPTPPVSPLTPIPPAPATPNAPAAANAPAQAIAASSIGEKP